MASSISASKSSSPSPGVKKTVIDNPKKLANLIDLVNLSSTLREFVGQSRISRLGCFMRVWSYIKTNNLQNLFPELLIAYPSAELFALPIQLLLPPLLIPLR
ncbi:hypothetical protein WN944_002153 [Citrus x changshan-huyou]|uniref:DM2 domain-containing protein n=1 Tax=Citrus x changshan-huyou TaxID=2935761 RepID=A0AAP0QS51_9ROSI